MKGKFIFIFSISFLLIYGITLAQGIDELLIDDFEGVISGETVDFGTGAGSSVDLSASKDIKYHGEQALKVDFDAVSGGYMWVARGYGLTVAGAAAWLVAPKDIDWAKYNALSVYVYGANTNAQIAIDVIDAGSEYWRYLIEDNFTGWKEFILIFSDFFARSDWQPDKADKNANLDFPITTFQFEPRPVAKGALYFDYARLVNAKK